MEMELEASPPGSSTMQCMEIRGGNRAAEHALQTPGLDLWIFSEPYHGEKAGGDVHYVSLCGGGIITRLIIADVSGHGESVDGFSVALRSLMRRNINSKSQARLVEALNVQFSELAQLRRFATAVVATYLATTDRLTISNAAHPRPLWYRASERSWSLLTHASGQVARPAPGSNLPLGVDEATAYEQFEVDLGAGDLVVIYTDALMEAMGPDRTMLGESGLLELAGELGPALPETFGRRLLAAVGSFRGAEPADDDVTLLVLHHNGGPPRHLSVGEKLDVYAKVFGLRAV